MSQSLDRRDEWGSVLTALPSICQMHTEHLLMAGHGLAWAALLTAPWGFQSSRRLSGFGEHGEGLVGAGE